MGTSRKRLRFERAKQRQGERIGFIGGGMITVVLTSVLLLILGVGSAIETVVVISDRTAGWVLSLVVFSAMAVGYLAGLVVFVRWVQLHRNGRPGRIRVIDAFATHSFRNNVPVYRVQAKVLDPGPERVVYVKVATFLGIHAGDQLDVLIDPKRSERMVVVRSPPPTDPPLA